MEYSRPGNLDSYESDDALRGRTISMERAFSDREIVQSAYPDETTTTTTTTTTDGTIPNTDHDDDDDTATPTFPLQMTLYLPKQQSTTAYIVLEWNEGYPVTSPLQVVIYRCTKSDANGHQRLEETVQAVRATARICYQDGIEAGLACCAAAFDAWNNDPASGCDEVHSGVGGTTEWNDTNERNVTHHATPSVTSALRLHPNTNVTSYTWLTGGESTKIYDRKSIFVGHVCTVPSESDIQPALQQLLYANGGIQSKQLQRATHHMVRTC
jgi:hypothetical protein